MNTKITARHFELTDEMKSLAEENFDSMQRFYENIISCHLTLDVEKHRKLAELKTTVFGQTITSTVEADQMYAAIESVFDKARGQLKRYKGKLKQKDVKRISAERTKAEQPKTDDDAVDY